MTRKNCVASEKVAAISLWNPAAQAFYGPGRRIIRAATTLETLIAPAPAGEQPRKQKESILKPCLAVILALFLLSHPASAGYLHRSHSDFVDGSGAPVLLRGVNLGNWLYIEPWMIGNTGFAMYEDKDGETDGLASAVLSLVGQKRTDAFYQTWRDNYVTQADIQKIAGLGFNSVRVPLDYRLFYDKAGGKDRDTGFTYLDRLLRWCGAAHIYVILDMHVVPGSKGNGKGNLFFDSAKQDILAHVWQRIAARYADSPWIGGYDLVNEPAIWHQAELSGAYKKVTQSIRAVDTHHMVIVEGDHWGSRLDLIGLNAPADVWDDNLALSDHAYGSSLAATPASDGRVSPYSLPAHQQLAARLDVPLWMGEFGYNSNTWNHAQRSLCEQGAIKTGWCVWAYKAAAIWSLTSFDIPPGYRRLQDYWRRRKANPRIPKPPADEAFRSLIALAQGAALGHCTVRRDVVDGLTRPDFATRAIPYRTGLVIPGRIAAVDYDMGAEGVAYHDTVSTDEAGKGPAGRPWNGGWNGRNDGVDVFPHPDGGLLYAVGGIQPGEWTAYTVTATPGTYALHIRYRSPGGGKMRVLLNGAPVSGPITLPAMGNWDAAKTLTVPRVRVSAKGRATLRLAFDTGGFSVHWVQFSR